MLVSPPREDSSTLSFLTTPCWFAMTAGVHIVRFSRNTMKPRLTIGSPRSYGPFFVTAKRPYIFLILIVRS